MGILSAPGIASLDTYGSLSALAALGEATPSVRQWIAVRERFARFHRKIQLTDAQRQDGLTKFRGVVRCLNRAYYGTNSESDHAFLIGSWGKGTAIRPPRDVDFYFVLPPEVHARFQEYTWNRQSALIQEVKGCLAETYPDTDMSGDGQVVLVRFESYSIEVVPAFLLQSGRYWICDTHDGGSYKETNPSAELRKVEAEDSANAGNLRPLIQMLKAWQGYCNVPIKSFHLELVAAQFLAQSPWRLYDWFWYDWLTRDFFKYLLSQANLFVVVPGGIEFVYLGDDWVSRTESAYRRALEACDNERGNYVYLAGEEWQKIFGPDIPLSV